MNRVPSAEQLHAGRHGSGKQRGQCLAPRGAQTRQERKLFLSQPSGFRHADFRGVATSCTTAAFDV